MSIAVEPAIEMPRALRWPQAGPGLALLAAIVSGVSVFVNGEAVGRFASPTVYTTGKNFISGVLLVAVAIGVHRSQSIDQIEHARWTRADIVRLVFVAVFGGAVPFVLFFEGLARATSSDAAFIHKTLVVWVAVLAVAFLHERLTALHVGAIALLVIGHVVLADGIGSLRPGLGEMLIFAATLCWAVELIVIKQLVATVPSTTIGTVRIGGGAAVLIGWLGVTGRLGDLLALSMSQWAWLVVTGAMLSGFVTLWFAAVARTSVIDVAAVLVLGAVVTGLLDVGLAHQPAAPGLQGWLLIAVGVGLIAVRSVADDRRPALGGG